MCGLSFPCLVVLLCMGLLLLVGQADAQLNVGLFVDPNCTQAYAASAPALFNSAPAWNSVPASAVGSATGNVTSLLARSCVSTTALEARSVGAGLYTCSPTRGVVQNGSTIRYIGSVYVYEWASASSCQRYPADQQTSILAWYGLNGCTAASVSTANGSVNLYASVYSCNAVQNSAASPMARPSFFLLSALVVLAAAVCSNNSQLKLFCLALLAALACAFLPSSEAAHSFHSLQVHAANASVGVGGNSYCYQCNCYLGCAAQGCSTSNTFAASNVASTQICSDTTQGGSNPDCTTACNNECDLVTKSISCCGKNSAICFYSSCSTEPCTSCPGS